MQTKARRATYIYNAIWFACFCWFGWWCFTVTTAPGARGGGLPVAMNAFGVGLAPMAILWLWKRWYTGKWIG